MPLSGTLNKVQIIDAAAERNRFTRKKSIETGEILLELIKQSLASGDDELISGFNKFCVKKKLRGRNPATVEGLMLAPKKVVTFQSPMKLREKLNQKKAAVNKDIAAKRHKKHKNKISGLVIPMGYNE